MLRQRRLDRRAAGLFLHPTSLPGPHGCGDLGPAAYRFVDFLADAGQQWWQMLPIGPPDAAGSPYSSCSAFAGSPLLVSLDRLREDGLLTDADLEPVRALRSGSVSFRSVTAYRNVRLRRAFKTFLRLRQHQGRAFKQFCRVQRAWLEDFALFQAMHDDHRGRSWIHWPDGARGRKRTVMHRSGERLGETVAFHCFVQYQFDQQWRALRRYCGQRDIGLIGDLPIYVAHDSADVWAHAELFQLDDRGRPLEVSGVPPDDFCPTGQLWGHPVFRWRRHASSGYAWWIERFQRSLTLFDAIRVDHFLGFNRYWAVPAGDRTARGGRWRTTPGHQLLSTLTSTLGPLPIIAEDLGSVTRAAVELRDRFGFLGMRVLQSAFGQGAGARYHLPENHPRTSVVFTSTHDTDTAVGWFAELTRRECGTGLQPVAFTGRNGRHSVGERERVLAYLQCAPAEVHWGLIRCAYRSPANLAIVPMQDVLGLDSKARMNRPARPKGNWRWRMDPRCLRPSLARRLGDLTEATERGR